MSINIRNIPWSNPVPHKGKYYRTAPATREMLDDWKADRVYLKKRGLGAYKDKGVWKLYLWTDTEEFQGDIKEPSGELPELPTIEPSVGSCKLLEPQVPHVARIVRALRMGGGAIDNSKTGTGKTICALVAAWNLGMEPIIVCPKSVIKSWQDWAAKTGQRVHVTNYAQVRSGNFPFCIRTDKDRPSYMKFEWKLRTPEKYIVIVDEAHNCKGLETLQGAILSSCKRAKVKVLMLSATLAESALDLKNAGYVLNLHHWSNWSDWLYANGCIKVKQKVQKRMFNPRTRKHWMSKFTIDKWVFKGGKDSLAKLREQIFPRMGSGLTLDDMDGYFPDNHIIPHVADIDSKIATIHRKMKKELGELAAKARRDGAREEGAKLTVMIRAQQEVELLKLPIAIEMARDAQAEGNSVMFACQFTETIKAFKKALGGCEVSGNVKDTASEIAKFQSDKEHFISVQVQAGGAGVSLHDDREGMRPRVSIIMPVFDARQFKQVLGRIHRANGRSTVKQYILFDSKSDIDKRICAAIEKKCGNMDSFNGDDIGIELQTN